MSAISEIMKDPFLMKFFSGLAKMLGEYYQEHAAEMTTDELYENAEFFPSYNPEKHDYAEKPIGYTCRNEDGTIMTLVSGIGGPQDVYMDNEITTEKASVSAVKGKQTVSEGVLWHYHWSTDPFKAKPFISSDISPYNIGECCSFNGKVYRSLTDSNTSSPDESPDKWEEVSDIAPTE